MIIEPRSSRVRPKYLQTARLRFVRGNVLDTGTVAEFMWVFAVAQPRRRRWCCGTTRRRRTLPRTLVPSDETRAALLARYGAAPQRLEEQIRGLPPVARSFTPPAGGWTITEVVIHLADNEAVDFVRMRKAIAESGSLIQRYDEEKWARELDYAADSVDEALLAFRVLRSRTHRLLNRVPEAAWGRVLRRPEGGQRTVAEKLRGDVEHDELHLRQMNQLRAAWDSTSSDA